MHILIPTSSRDGLTALHCAASRGHTRCVDILIKLCGAQTDLIDSNGCTALFYAVTLGHADATVKLLDLAADPNRQDRKGRSPVHCGCAKAQFETVKILSARGANLWLRNARGDLPVHEAAASGRIELVQWLLQQKPNHINTSSNDGRTIMHIAAGNDNIDMCTMLIEAGADVNAVYRNAKNVVKTPLDCALQKGFRSTAKFIQMHGGLPASKLRLSGRKTHNILPELDEVKPLKFTEIEVSYEPPSAKGRRHSHRGRSGSDSEDSTAAGGSSRHRKRHRKCSHKRRTSSCSETFICHRVDEPCDISRSKSTTELHRRKKCKQHSASSSSSATGTSDSDSSDGGGCCYHTKRKHRCYKKVRDKSKDRERGGSKKRKGSESKKGSESSECKENGQHDKDQQQRGGGGGGGKKDHKKKVEIASSAKKNDSKASSLAAATTAKAKADAAKGTSKTPPASAKKRPPSAKPAAVQKKSSQDGKAASIDKPKTPEIPDEPSSIDISKKSTTPTDDASEEDKGAKEIITQAEVHENLLQTTDVDEGALTDATYTVERRDKSDFTALEPEIMEQEESALQSTAAESSKKVSFVGDDEAKAKTPEPPQPATAVVEEVPIVAVESKAAVEKEKPPPVAVVQDDYDENDTDYGQDMLRPKSQTPESVGSFTVLEDGDDAEQKLKEFEEMTQDESYNMMTGLDDEESEQQYFDDSSSQEKVPQRSKNEGGGFMVLADESKDQDSGFEPSPRALRTKIPAPRSLHSSALPMPSRKAFTVAAGGVDDRPRSTRVEGRKPGDKNAVNMTTVTQSIQKNIRR